MRFSENEVEYIDHCTRKDFEARYGENRDYKIFVRCRNCKFWRTTDGMFKDIDERLWHHCTQLEDILTKNHLDSLTEEYHYCGWGEPKDE